MKTVNRIKKSEDFVFTIKKGQAFRNRSYVIHVCVNNSTHTRVGISVSSKLGNAVVRSRIKRQIRAMCMSLIDFNAQALNVVIIAKHPYLEGDFCLNKQLLSDLLKLGRVI